MSDYDVHKLKERLTATMEAEPDWAHCCGQSGTGVDAINELVELVVSEIETAMSRGSDNG